jgi:hypothetical protein
MAPPGPNRTELKLALPYDLAWDAVHTVIADNEYRIIVEDPNEGVIETEAAGTFTLADADCGHLSGIAGKYRARPNKDSSVVYNFHVRPEGGEASVVGVDATFTAPVQIPLRPPSGVQCVSRGVQEARLLDEVAAQAKKTHRPHFIAPSADE